MRFTKPLLRAVLPLTPLLLLLLASGCCSTCHDSACHGSACDPCGPRCYTTIEVVNDGCTPQCCPQGCPSPCGADDCCEEEKGCFSWCKGLSSWGKKKDRDADTCCGTCDPCCGNAVHGYGDYAVDGACERCPAGCEPHPYLAIGGYDQRLDDRVVICAADDCAEEALERLERDGRGVSRDYERGFRNAYRDVALGGDGRVPAVPPRSYWQAARRTREGHARAQQWFAGYEMGARYAQADGVHPYRHVPTPASHLLEPGSPPYPRESFTPNGPMTGANPFPTPPGPPVDAVCPPTGRTPDHVPTPDAAVPPTRPLPILPQSGRVLDGPAITRPAVHRRHDSTIVEPQLWPF